ncbi:hypothetical protein BDZ89DRAFT_1047918 [Hymenopellis radicata]|nr:hypothetical protein BDZ89DRAFT_1047918 [Hymenopellis radicata]
MSVFFLPTIIVDLLAHCRRASAHLPSVFNTLRDEDDIHAPGVLEYFGVLLLTRPSGTRYIRRPHYGIEPWNNVYSGDFTRCSHLATSAETRLDVTLRRRWTWCITRVAWDVVFATRPCPIWLRAGGSGASLSRGPQITTPPSTPQASPTPASSARSPPSQAGCIFRWCQDLEHWRAALHGLRVANVSDDCKMNQWSDPYFGPTPQLDDDLSMAAASFIVGLRLSDDNTCPVRLSSVWTSRVWLRIVRRCSTKMVGATSGYRTPTKRTTAAFDGRRLQDHLHPARTSLSGSSSEVYRTTVIEGTRLGGVVHVVRTTLGCALHPPDVGRREGGMILDFEASVGIQGRRVIVAHGSNEDHFAKSWTLTAVTWDTATDPTPS